MELETAPPEIDTTTPPQETPIPASPPAEDSLAAHEAEFSPPKLGDERDDQGRFKPRPKHRAESQKASPADSPRIADLTKKYRTAEQERDALKAEVERLKSAPHIAPARAPEAARTEPPISTSAFATPKPTLNDFAASDDPYGDLQVAKALWEFDKRQFDSSQKDAATKAERDVETAFQQIKAGYDSKVTAFVKAHPDFDTVLAASPTVELTPLLKAAILTDDNGPALVYALAQHLDWQYEMHLLTDGKAVTDQAVASLQRLLNTRVQAVSTGSVAPPSPPPHVPKPPNPVRTGPMNTGDEPPGENASLADHERAYGVKRRR